jgi:hypothetical protein
MGQYYKPINIDKKQYVYSHDFGNGLKLMEHSYVGNHFVNAVESLLCEGGAWHGDRIVWAGDYADPEKGARAKRYKDSSGQMKSFKPNLFDLIDDGVKKEMRIKPDMTEKNHRFVINLDTKQFVDTEKVPLTDVYTDEHGKEWPFTIHPLPILTCEGNGRGGGDLHKEDPLVGTWARQRVVVSDTKPEGFKELKFNIYEGSKPAKLSKPKKAKVTA